MDGAKKYRVNLQTEIYTCDCYTFVRRPRMRTLVMSALEDESREHYRSPLVNLL